MDVDVDGHRKFGIIAPLNFAIISSGRTDGGREGRLGIQRSFLFNDSSVLFQSFNDYRIVRLISSCD